LSLSKGNDPRGAPVFFFHGIPGSRIFRPPDEITAKMGVRLICVDRPGYGLSSFQPNRRILDWPDDIAQLADALTIEKFVVAGHSGGGPYVAACACKLPGRVIAAAILCGVGPLDAPTATKGMWGLNRFGLVVGRYIPWPLWRLLIWCFYHQGRDDPVALMERDAESRPRADAELWENPAIREVCYASTKEALRLGTRGHAWEARLLTRPWGFSLEDIRVPVFLWHGTADRETPISMGRYVASKIPNCRATFREGEGHILLFNHWEEMLAEMLGSTRPAPPSPRTS
ncbi:MAG: alpha/beta hydrolase, partial [Anaerolineales bacterium]|nr:alpha/beta hydrolase [Anaerolineales bacterium]